MEWKMVCLSTFLAASMIYLVAVGSQWALGLIDPAPYAELSR